MTTPSTARKAGPFTGTGSQSSWPFTFKVFAAGDIKVTIADTTGAESVLVLDTDYTVSLNANQDTSPGGTVAYLLADDYKLTITGDLDYDQSYDIPSGGNFNPVALENQLDRMVMQTQQLAEEMVRAVKVPVTDDATGQLSQDLADGILALSPIVADIETVAGDIAAVENVSVHMSAVSAVGGNINNVNTVAGISSNVTSVAGNATNINAVAAKTTQITQVAAIDDEVAAVASNATNVNTVAGIAANVTTVAGISGNVTTVAGISSSVTTVAGAAADVAVVADNIADVSNFADVYLGSKTSAPTLRNDGSALQPGDLYFDSVNDKLRAYGAGGWADGVTATPVTITAQTFSGNGSTTAFTLSAAPAFEAACDVYIGGVAQVVDVDYNISGTTLTFTSAPPSGTNNVAVKILSAYAAGTPSNGSVTTEKLADGAVTAEKLAPGASITAKLLRVKHLTVSGTYTPGSDVKEFYAQVYGATGNNNNTSTAGPGGPGYSEKYYPSPSGSYSFTIGAAGSSGLQAGTTTFDVMSVTGSFGTASGGGGGVGSGGDFNATGGAGSTTSNMPGGAGSRAGVGGAGSMATPGGTGGLTGSGASGVTTGVISMPWGNANETFFGGYNVGGVTSMSFGAPGVPILKDSSAPLFALLPYYSYSVTLPVAAVPASTQSLIRIPTANGVSSGGSYSAAGLPGMVIIIEVLK